MARLAIWSHAASDTVNALKVEVAAQGDNLIKIRRTNSNFTGRAGDVIINYGDSNMPSNVIGRATVLNPGHRIGNASNKSTAFRTFADAGVKTVDFTTSRTTAQEWVDNGELVYARTRLQGHSGEGIVACHREPSSLGNIGGIATSESAVSAQLYTRGITADRREFRIHVMKGKITYVQQKKRRDGYADMEEYSAVVRNYHTGWIYATQMAQLNDEAKREALKAIEALGLDYGAVDVITRRDEAWVLEVNTAPGMTGTNLTTFAANCLRILNGQEVEEVMPAPSLDNLQREINETPAAAPAASPRTVRETLQRQATPAPAAAPASPAQAPAPTPTPAPASRNTRAESAPTPQNNGVYLIVVDGERTVGKFDGRMTHFEIVGWEVPVAMADATIVEQLCVL
ncbi:putative ATP-grasp enzyme [Salmonella phage pSal-SNUABM-01]|nr:putative ATP-grasp enzyme [Salmonella phage pSal-SNUABM-01]